MVYIVLFFSLIHNIFWHGISFLCFLLFWKQICFQNIINDQKWSLSKENSSNSILQPLASIQRYYIDFRNPRLLEPGESSALPLPWISAAGVHPTPGTFSSFFSFERHVPWWVERLQPGWELLLTLPLAFTTAKENRSFHLSKSQLLHHCSNLAKSSSHSRVALSKGADAWKQTLDTSGCEIQF